MQQRICSKCCRVLAAACLVVLAAACSSETSGGRDQGGSDLFSAGDLSAVLDGAGGADGGEVDGQGAGCSPTELVAQVDPARMLQDLTFLTGLPSRSTPQGQEQAAAYLRAQLDSVQGISVREQSYSLSGASYVNIEATIVGSENPTVFVMAGGHYDADDGTAGADDNASGAVAVLEAARVLAACQPKNSVRLLLFSNEENGTAGSSAYVDELKATVAPDQVIGFVGTDMVGYGAAGSRMQIETRPEYGDLANATSSAVTQLTALDTKLVIDDHCG